LLTAVLLTGSVHGAGAQSSTPSLPTLPERRDTLTVAFGTRVIGRGIMTWTRRGGEQLQVYVWTSASDGSSVTDSLFADPRTLRPLREVRIVEDTVITVLFERDTIWLLTTVAGRQTTSRAVAPPPELYSSAAIESLAATMPLESGATKSFRTYYAPPSTIGVRSTMLSVEETVRIDGRAAWRVVANTPGGGTTFWVDAETRTVLQSETREGDALFTFRRRDRR
jgi:hypothetical protein